MEDSKIKAEPNQYYKKKYIFWFILIIVVLILVYMPVYYSSNYWEKLLFVNELNSTYSKVVLLFQISCLILASLIIFYRNKLFLYRKEILLLILSTLIFIIFIEIGSRYYVCNYA